MRKSWLTECKRNESTPHPSAGPQPESLSILPLLSQGTWELEDSNVVREKEPGVPLAWEQQMVFGEAPLSLGSSVRPVSTHRLMLLPH